MKKDIVDDLELRELPGHPTTCLPSGSYRHPHTTNNRLFFQFCFASLETLLRRARSVKALIEAAIIVAYYCISGNQTCIKRTSTFWIPSHAHPAGLPA
jgi:hypothetical protein